MNILLTGRASSRVNIEEGSFPHPGKANYVTEWSG